MSYVFVCAIVDMPLVDPAAPVAELDTTMEAGGAEVTTDMTTMIQAPEHGFVLEPLPVGIAEMAAYEVIRRESKSLAEKTLLMTNVVLPGCKLASV